jgi:hypothetical protein
MIEIRKVETKKDWDAFIALPFRLYKGDRFWAPPLRIAVRDQLDVAKHPFFRHAFLHPLLAFRDGKLVGRAVGVIDENNNKFHEEKTMFFGFYESENDPAITRALLDAIVAWGKGKGMTTLRGPMNPGTNYECGLLVDGFQDPPNVMMTYNPPYYADLFESFGLAKCKDLYAYDVDGRKSKFSERLVAQSERLKKRSSITFRQVNMRDFDGEIARILEIYNDAWEKNWGFVPMDADEFRHMAKDMKMILDPRLLLIAEVNGEPAAFGLTLPDVNQIFMKVRDGKLFPTGLLKLLWHLKGPFHHRTVNRCRILTLGIKKKFRETALGPLFYTEYFKLGPQVGYPVGEASWILEDNKPMNRALELMGATKTKTYRIYERTV